MRFDFIKQAIKEIKYPRFFHCEPLTKLERRRLEALPAIPPSYLEFLNLFGRARFFRELDQDTHHLHVFPPSEKLHFCGDSYMLDVAATAYSMPIAFKISELVPRAEPPVYDVAVGVVPASPRKRADSFTEWLTKAWERSRRRYTRKVWAKVLCGPDPFTPDELRTVEVRRSFSWRQLPPENGLVRIEFTNRSDSRLPRYTIGVKDKYGVRMTGAFFVDVSHIAPKTTAVVHVPLAGYSHLLSAEISVLFDRGEPKPESRGSFAEFKVSKDNTA